MAIWGFLIAHWYLSLFAQTFFLHRYAAHRIFKLSPFWEKFFYMLTFLVQGSSFLNPRAYAIMHRMHHAYSDTERDPHSPHHSKGLFDMMLRTYRIYEGLLNDKIPPGNFIYRIPKWDMVDKLGRSWTVRICFGGLYVAYYFAFAPSAWYFLLLPVHILMGPIQGALVNWCGHKYGYVNHTETNDKSTNVLPIEVLLFGEFFQNNHHQNSRSPNFAHRWFEFDPTFALIRLFKLIGIVRFS